LGAQGVQIASRFVTTEECDADLHFKEAYLNAGEDDVEIILSPVGMPGRALKNEFLIKVKQGQKIPKSCPYHCLKTCDYEKSPYCIMMALYNAYKGNMDKGYAFAGINAFRNSKITTVKDVISSLLFEYKEAKENAKSKKVE